MRLLLGPALAALGAVSGCELARPSVFGEPCASDAACGALRCHPVEGRCLPPPRVDRQGASCDEAASIHTDEDSALWRANAALRLTSDNTADNTEDGELSCGAGRVHYVALKVPVRRDEDDQPLPGIVLEVRATAQRPVAVALLDARCGETMPHACAAGAFESSPSFVVPFLPPGDYVVAIVAADDEELSLDVALELTQIACPPGFVPDGDGCRGFVAIPGPEPRVRHDLLPLSSRAAVAIAGQAPDGHADVAVFDRRVLQWSTTGLPGDFQEPCGFLSSRGELFVLAGRDAGSVGQVALAGLRGFRELPTDTATWGIGMDQDCLAVPLSSPDLALVLGGAVPERLVRDGAESPFQLLCTGDFMCGPGETCVARFPDAANGVCTCVLDECDAGVGGFSAQNATGPEVLEHLRGMSAVVLSSAPGDAAVLVLAAVGDHGPIDPWVYLEREQLWVPTSLVLQHRTYADAALIGDIAVVAGGIAEGGGDAFGPGAGSDVVELIALGANRVEEARLATPRRESAVGAFGDHEAIVIGGRPAHDALALATTEIVDVLSGAVRSGPMLPEALYGHRAVQLGDELLLAGGRDGAGQDVASAYLLVRSDAALRPAGTLESFVSTIGGDTCADAANLADYGGPTGDVFSSTLGRTHDYWRGDFDDCEASLDSLDSVFRIDLTAGQRVSFEVIAAHEDVGIALAVLNRCPADASSAVACTEPGGTFGPAGLEVTADADGSYFLVVTRYVSLQDVNHEEERPFGFRLLWNVEDAP